ncbi:ferredoxin--NADP reductase [Vibrio sp.]|uniref:ferredoxin--NADP reductase n=1 Tax=Vibrio sp. TaxID=678 RepID=UPI003D14B962
MNSINGFHQATVARRTDWSDGLYSLTLSGAPLDFLAGQFTKLALADEEGKPISRAYSLVNAPDRDGKLEFLIVNTPEGKLTSKLFDLQPGDQLYVGSTAHGDLIWDSVPDQCQDLWLLSTGTGIGPFLSLIEQAQQEPLTRNIILVHGVRHESDLAYREQVNQWLQSHAGQLHYIPVISREARPGILQGHIPKLIETGQLTRHAGIELSPERSFVMLCGNPAMIKDTLQVLQQFGLEKFRRATGGHILHERYW